MPKNTSIKKVLVIGSGPIVIGQAAEFDPFCKTLTPIRGSPDMSTTFPVIGKF